MNLHDQIIGSQESSVFLLIICVEETAVGTVQQKDHKVDDKIEWYVEDTMKGGRYANDPKLVQILAEQSADGIKWLESLGANMDDLKRSGGARVDRTHR